MAKKVMITLEGYQCERCDHKWIPKGAKEPRTCPDCKSPYWDVPKKNKKTKA
jgi:predicted Zn-ribbon and HTH transcriptional regulator